MPYFPEVEAPYFGMSLQLFGVAFSHRWPVYLLGQIQENRTRWVLQISWQAPPLRQRLVPGSICWCNGAWLGYICIPSTAIFNNSLAHFVTFFWCLLLWKLKELGLTRAIKKPSKIESRRNNWKNKYLSWYPTNSFPEGEVYDEQFYLTFIV